MAYDKQSFLAGLSAGSQLKGWAAYPSAQDDRVRQMSLRTSKLRTSPPILTAELSAVMEYSTCVLNTPGIILIQTFEEVS